MTGCYWVIQEQPCTACTGTGVVQAAIWQQYWEENQRSLPTPEDDYAWFREQGYSVYQVADLPPEEEPCSECAGTGKLRREVSLALALQDLGML